MDFNYTKIKFGNWLYRNCFPLYNIVYSRFKIINDADEIAVLKKNIRSGDHVLDIGANIGFYARVLSELVGEKGHVYCFEPDSANFNYLKKNTRSLQNITLFKAAVSDRAGELKVYRSKLLNVDHRTYPVNNYDSVEDVQSLSIDELIREKKIQKVDLIKIDIQGYELVAFTGMQNLLQQNDHIRILAEYWPHGFKRAGSSALEFYDFFDRLSYRFSIIEKGNIRPLSRDFVAQHNNEPFEFSFNVLIEKRDH